MFWTIVGALLFVFVVLPFTFALLADAVVEIGRWSDRRDERRKARRAWFQGQLHSPWAMAGWTSILVLGIAAYFELPNVFFTALVVLAVVMARWLYWDATVAAVRWVGLHVRK